MSSVVDPEDRATAVLFGAGAVLVEPIEAVAKRLGLELGRVVINLDRYGNTVGATIPIALAEWHQQRRFAYGDRVVLAAFGAGFTSAAVYLRWAAD